MKILAILPKSFDLGGFRPARLKSSCWLLAHGTVEGPNILVGCIFYTPNTTPSVHLSPTIVLWYALPGAVLSFNVCGADPMVVDHRSSKLSIRTTSTP
jgi:hypothetical protein